MAARGRSSGMNKTLLPSAPLTTTAEILVVQDLAIHFGGVHALDGVSLSAHSGMVTGVIGPNGAGKTTLFNCLSGLLTPDRGQISFAGHQVFPGHRFSGTPRRRARLGLGRTFQTPRLFRSLPVLDNLALGCRVAESAKRTYAWDPELTDLPRNQRAERIAELVGLNVPLSSPTGGLSFGDLRVVELARALCAAPNLVLLDEPASGLDAEQAVAFVALLRSLSRLGIGILLIEHDMSVVMDICEQLTVLDFGQVIARGTPEEIQNNDDVIHAYLGRAH
jgi:ABC-type branched-subunit amino acid transport system ATPase component